MNRGTCDNDDNDDDDGGGRGVGRVMLVWWLRWLWEGWDEQAGGEWEWGGKRRVIGKTIGVLYLPDLSV